MARITIGLGVLLILVGMVAYVATGSTHKTALIPAGLGLPIAIAGALALEESRRKHAVHAALALALLGFFGTLRGLTKLPALLSGADVERPAAVAAQGITALLCLGFIVLGVRSFMAARRG